MFKRKHRKLRILFLLLLILLMCAVFGFLYLVLTLDKIQNHELTKVSENKIHDKNMSDYTNLVIYGVDSRANDLQKNTRSDSIIIASIHNKTHEVKLTSVYRDTYVQIDGHGLTKVNHAYAFGGPDLSVQTLNQNFDLNIHDFITVNFSSLTNVIDDLGGISLRIRKEERKWVNAYAKDVAKINNKPFTKIKKCGTQTVTGVQATAYCRVRYTSGGDFTRAKRQRMVLEAVFAKAKKTNPFKLVTVMNDMLPQIYTSLTTTDILKLAWKLPLYKISSQKGFPYKLDCHRGADGIYYDFPTTLASNVKKLHQRLFHTVHYKVSPTVKQIDASMGNP